MTDAATPNPFHVGDLVRLCGHCGELKKPEAFYNRNDGKRGKRTVCRACCIARDVARKRAVRVARANVTS